MVRPLSARSARCFRARCLYATLATLFLAAPAAAAPASAAQLPPQGLYEGCAPYLAPPECADHLAQIGSAGFRLVLNYSGWYGNAAQIQAYAAAAQSAGVRLIWPLNDPAWRDPGSATSLLSNYSTLAPTCGCSDNSGFVQYAINLVRSLPATWGYYIGDELGPSQASTVAALAAAVRQADPSHPLLYVGVGSATFTSNLQPFESIANYVGEDVYPIGSGGSVSAVGPIAKTVAGLAQASGAGPAMVLQAFDWNEYPGTQSAPPSWPSESQMQTMRDEALAANPSLILWYSYQDIQRSDDPTGHWRDLMQAAFAPVQSTPGGSSGRPAAHSASSRRHRHRRSRRVVAGVASLRARRHRSHRRRHARHHRARHHGHHRARHHGHSPQHREPDIASVLTALDALLLF